MDRTLSCCFSGHRSILDEDFPKIEFLLFQETERLIQGGVDHFITGGALGFDTLAALTVIELRREYPQIALELALPCKNQCRRWSKENVLQYQNILSLADNPVFSDWLRNVQTGRSGRYRRPRPGVSDHTMSACPSAGPPRYHSSWCVPAPGLQ